MFSQQKTLFSFSAFITSQVLIITKLMSSMLTDCCVYMYLLRGLVKYMVKARWYTMFIYLAADGLPWLTSSSDSSRGWSSLEDTSNLLIQAYHEGTADNTLCLWIETPGKTTIRYYAVYNRSCNRNINDTLTPLSLRPLFLNAKRIDRNHYWPYGGNSYPAHFYTHTPHTSS